MRWWSDDVEALAAQQFGGIEVLGIRNCLVFGPDAHMVSYEVSLTPDPDPSKVRGDLDAATDRARMHRVVVAG
jgi:hypothetical protein